MTFIKVNPFNTVDPTEFMIDEVARRAEAEGRPLIQDERELLRSEYVKGFKVSPEQENRLLALVRTIVAQEERDSPKDYRVHTFGNALEWASDMTHPYVAYLASVVYGEKHPGWRRKALFQLVATGTVLVVIVVLAIMILGRVFK